MSMQRMCIKGILTNMRLITGQDYNMEDLSPGEIEEIVEDICEEQAKQWETDSVGWKVLEALKIFVRIN